MLPNNIFDREISFVLWSLVALIGLILLGTGTYPSRARPDRAGRRIAGAGLLLLGIAAATPYAPRVFRDIRELLTPEPPATQLVLAQDQTIEGIAFQAGSIVAVLPDGVLVSAELKSPHSIDGLTVTGHAEFWRVNVIGGTYATHFSQGTLAADQEIPNSSGAWCSGNQPIRMDVDLHTLGECDLARPLTRDSLQIPAGAHLKYRTSAWSIDLSTGGGPALIDGLTIPAGWSMLILIDPDVTLASLYAPGDPGPETQLWVEIHGLRITGRSINFTEHGTIVEGELWQDATIEGKPHKKGESVQFRR